ncbi:hypothetical protein CN934_28355 [Ensifer sp. MMN_5]|nr:hypothetical protein CN934_28355 [Ensifer sp. MMN_5]
MPLSMKEATAVAEIVDLLRGPGSGNSRTSFPLAANEGCLYGFNLHETLTRELPLVEVLAKKVRRAAETGGPVVRVRQLF